MDHNNHEKQQPSDQHYSGQPPFSTQYSASAPTEFPIPPPPQYSVLDPSYSQQPHAPFLQHQQQPVVIQQQPQVQHIVVHQIPG